MKDFDKKNWICIEGFSFFFQNQQNKQPKESETRKFKQNRKAKKQGGKNEKTPKTWNHRCDLLRRGRKTASL
jgi:hypothetical protein